MPVAFNPLFRETNISSLCCKSCQSEPKGISSVAVHDHQGIDDISLGFAHLLALGIPDKGVNVNLTEWHLFHEMQPHHHHSCHPEKKNIETGNQNRSGVKALELSCLLRPSHGGEWPESGTEPGIQHIALLNQVFATTATAFFRLLHGNNDFVAILTVPCGNAVSPPDLT